MPILSVALVDSYQRETRKLFEMETQADLATYLATAAAFLTDLLAVTQLGLVRADIIIPSGVAGSAPAAGSNVDDGVTISGYSTDGNGAKASVKIPGPETAYINADGTVDVENVALAEYLAHFEAAGAFTVSDGETIASWIRGQLDR